MMNLETVNCVEHKYRFKFRKLKKRIKHLKKDKRQNNRKFNL